MRIFALVSIAALAAALPATDASAQQRGDRAGHSWGQPRGGGHHGGPGMHRPRVDRGDHYRARVRNFHRVGRGQVLPRRWFGPQYQVRHWQHYGFPAPQHGMRWVRYYDDALLIDGRGTVHDGRFGFDWDSYGDRWIDDEGGVPVYAGDGDFRPGDEDYEYAEGHASGWDYSDYEGQRGPHGPPPQGCGPCGAPANGYAVAPYGYGYVSGGTVTITETVVTTGGSGYSEEIIEEYEEQAVQQRQRRVRRAPPPRRPIRGERG